MVDGKTPRDRQVHVVQQRPRPFARQDRAALLYQGQDRVVAPFDPHGQGRAIDGDQGQATVEPHPPLQPFAKMTGDNGLCAHGVQFTDPTDSPPS